MRYILGDWELEKTDQYQWDPLYITIKMARLGRKWLEYGWLMITRAVNTLDCEWIFMT